jgi:hypothetical protein
MTKKKKSSSKTAQDAASSDEKVSIFESLTQFYDALRQAESARRRMGYGEEADLIAHWEDRLNEVMDEMRGKILEDWMTDAKAIQTEIETQTDAVENRIKELKADVKRADTVTKIVAQVEQVITKLAALIK